VNDDIPDSKSAIANEDVPDDGKAIAEVDVLDQGEDVADDDVPDKGEDAADDDVPDKGEDAADDDVPNKIKDLTNVEIPDIVVGRLPIYLRALSDMAREEGRDTTSSQELGKKLGISSAQIRKDLSQFGEFGKQGTGYHVDYLMEQLRQILHLTSGWPVVLVGAGFLGHALVHYRRFQLHDFHIKWVFDSDPEKVGVALNDVKVLPMSALKDTVGAEQVRMAILAVPASAAQAISDVLVEAGVRAILNYAPISLDVPKGVYVQYSDPVVQLQHMTYYL